MGNGTNIVLTPQSSIDHGSLGGLTDIADHPGYVALDGTRALTAAWDAGGYNIRSLTFQSDVATGTAPFTVASTTVVTNLNADQCDGFHAQTATAANTIAVRDASQYIFAVRFASDGTYYINPANTTTSAVFAGNITMAASKTVDGVDISTHEHNTSGNTDDDFTVTATDKGTSECRADWGAGLAATWVYASADSGGSSPAWKQIYVQVRGHYHAVNLDSGAPL